jgi:glutaredoxin
MSLRLVVYVSPWCFNCTDTRDALTAWGVPATYVDIKQDAQAAKRVRTWTGFESVPTLVIAEEDNVEPHQPPAALTGRSPRGVDRGTMLTEPTRNELGAWLVRNGFLQEEAVRK